MANHASAIKRIRQNERRRLRNRVARGEMRTAIKKFRTLIESKQADEAKSSLPGVYDLIDRTRKKGVIHANTASRYKSRLARALNNIEG